MWSRSFSAHAFILLLVLQINEHSFELTCHINKSSTKFHTYKNKGPQNISNPITPKEHLIGLRLVHTYFSYV